ncbi:MAG: hypothetical protein KGL39_03710 [Patescibacteria group bacterium]|nr:hypothetical protein [Patescibacteria group bacterium]
MADEKKTDDDGFEQGELQLDDPGEVKADELEKLREELAAAKARADSAEARASTFETQSRQTTTQLSDAINSRFAAQEQALASAIGSAEATVGATRDLLAKAHEEGRFTDVASLTEKLADAKSTLNNLNWQKSQIEVQKADAAERAKQQAAIQSTDPTERLISSVPEGRGREWLRGHRDIANKMATDQRYLARVNALHNQAFADGLEPNTDGYFERIEIGLGLREDPNKQQETQVTDTTKQAPKRNSTAAPPSRTVTVGVRQQQGGARVALTDKEKADALWMFPDVARKDGPEAAEKLYIQGMQSIAKRPPDLPWERVQ